MKTRKPKLPAWKHSQSVHQIRFDPELNKLERMRSNQAIAGNQEMQDLVEMTIRFYRAEHPR